MTASILPVSAVHATYSQAMLNSSYLLEYIVYLHNYQSLHILVTLLEMASLLLFSWIAQFNLKIQLKYHFFFDFPYFSDSLKQVDQSHSWVPQSIWIIIVSVLATKDCCFSISVGLSP